MKRIAGTAIQTIYANTFRTRLFGLMFTKVPPRGSGLVLEPCRSIHMFFMNYPIDVIVLDREQNIIAMHEGLRPGKVTPYYKNASCFIEFEITTIAREGFFVGQHIDFEEA